MPCAGESRSDMCSGQWGSVRSTEGGSGEVCGASRGDRDSKVRVREGAYHRDHEEDKGEARQPEVPESAVAQLARALSCCLECDHAAEQLGCDCSPACLHSTTISSSSMQRCDLSELHMAFWKEEDKTVSNAQKVSHRSDAACCSMSACSRRSIQQHTTSSKRSI